jgi:hypothetical protein
VDLSICGVCDDYCDIYDTCDEYYDIYMMSVMNIMIYMTFCHFWVFLNMKKKLQWPLCRAFFGRRAAK